MENYFGNIVPGVFVISRVIFHLFDISPWIIILSFLCCIFVHVVSRVYFFPSAFSRREWRATVRVSSRDDFQSEPPGEKRASETLRIRCRIIIAYTGTAKIPLDHDTIARCAGLPALRIVASILR